MPGRLRYWRQKGCRFDLGLVVSLSLVYLCGSTAPLRFKPSGRRVVSHPAAPKYPCWSIPDASFPKFSRILKPCYSRHGVVQCRCNDFIQDCSSNAGGLTFVPRPANASGVEVQVLNFSNNALLKIDSAGFFSNVTDQPLWLLDLYNNDLTHIHPSLFARLPHLTNLLLGGNSLGYPDLRQAVFSVPTLQYLDIKCGGLKPMPDGLFNKTAADLRLEKIDFSWNRIVSLDMKVFQPLVRLKELVIWHNSLNSLTTAYLPSLYYVSFHKNLISHFPQTCKEGTNESLFPNLEILDLNFNTISSLPDPICLPKLELLNLQYNRIQSFYPNMFTVARFPSLRKLEMNQMENRIRSLPGYVFNNSRIEHITFGLNYIDFSQPSYSAHLFGGCSGLSNLYLSHNNFGAVSKEKFQCLFRPMPRLNALSLKRCLISQLDSESFSGLTKLETLDLTENELSFIPDGVFDGLISLKKLFVNSNHLTTITSQTFSPQTIERLQRLDLSGNPFECSCDILWFQQLMKERPQLFVDDFGDGYHCVSPPKVTLADFSINQQACLLSRLAANDILILGSLLIVALGLTMLGYGYRWQLRLWLYEVCRGRHRRDEEQADRDRAEARHFRYDVFLAYAEEDGGWVRRELLPMLEERWRLRVCLHQRDFLPGKHILDNICDSVEQSRRCLAVLSPSFARSQWCQFEIRHCQSAAMDRRDVMVLVAVRETDPRDLTGPMLAVLKTTTYISWGHCPEARASFWGRLAMALHDVIQQRQNAQVV